MKGKTHSCGEPALLARKFPHHRHLRGLRGRRLRGGRIVRPAQLSKRRAGLRGTAYTGPGARAMPACRSSAPGKYAAGEHRPAHLPQLYFLPRYGAFDLPRLHGRKYDAVFCYETSPVLMMLPGRCVRKLHRVPPPPTCWTSGRKTCIP